MPHQDVKELASGFSFLEAPRWRDGRLYASDFYTQRVLAFDEQGGVETVCETSGRQPSGLGFLPDGSMLIVSMIDRKVMRLVDGRLEDYADLSGLASSNCNDMLVDERGLAYVGNFGWAPQAKAPPVPTRIIIVEPGGAARQADGDVIFPNGMVRTADGRLVVAETFASRLSQFDIGPQGELTNHRIWAELAPGGPLSIADAVASGNLLPDGICIDAEGMIWVADAAGQGALRVAEGGEIVERVDTGALAVFAVALGGADGKTLFLCAAPPLLSHDPADERRAVLLACKVDVGAP